VSKDPLDAVTSAGRAGWQALVSRPQAALLAVDYDGTLAPIVPRPEDAVPATGAVAALADLAGLGVAVYVITGRPAPVAVELGGLDAVPDLVVLGHYGLQRWQRGHLTTPDPHPGVAEARASLAAYVAQQADGSTLEDKHHSVALHTRNATDPAAAFDRARPMAQTLAQQAGLQLVPGRFVLELRPHGIDKGGALRQAVEETGARAVLVAGDDLGDLPALDAVDALRASGTAALVVCSDSGETPAALRERSDLAVDGPSGVVEVLAGLAAAIRA
jgi:trehalose 6-phosphate phosphatase